MTLPDGQTTDTDAAGLVQVMTRPRNLRLSTGHTGAWRGKVSFHRPIGASIEYYVDMTDGTTVQVAAMRQERARPLQQEDPASLPVIAPSFCVVYPV